MKTGLIILLFSLGLLGYSLTLKPYKNEAEFQSRYMQMTENDSDKYYALREEMLTPKYKLQDYAITGMFLALCVLVISRQKSITSPRSKSGFLIIAFVTPSLFVIGYVFDLIQGADRGEFPHWADSLGIPLAGVPFLFLIGLAWSLIHLVMLRGAKFENIPLQVALSKKSNPWLLFISMATAIIIVLSIYGGTYWYTIPCALWLYLYLAIAACRRGQNVT